MNKDIDLTLLVPEFPEIPHIEIPRDALVSRLFRTFGPDCQKQVVISDDHYGKTNLLSQFCRRYPKNSIGYFITSNPITHNYRNFLYVICNQMSRILDGESLPVAISEADLKNIYLGLSVKLTEYAKMYGQKFFVVIDGIETALESEVGSVIVNNPPILSPSSPYLLFSSSLSTFGKLPEQLIKGARQHDFEAALQFNIDDTEKYLSDFSLTSQEIILINEKSKGVAGYLAVLSDSIKTTGKDWIYAGDLPDNLLKLINNQVDHVFITVMPLVRECIEIIAVVPKPLSPIYLHEYFNENIPLDQLSNTGLVIFDSSRNLLSLKQNLAKQVIQDKLGKRKTELKRKLLEIVRKSSKHDDELMTLLLEELNDYSGLVELLDINTIKKSFDAGNINTVMERMRKTLKLALDTNKTEDISKWCWGLTATREFLSHISTTHEIDALIAIGESQKALNMAYNFPESISKIRLLARVYTSMKDRHEHVPMSALEELQIMLDEVGIDSLEKEVVQDIAFDILPLLPNKAVFLLEKVIGEPREQNLIDVAISTVKAGVDENNVDFSKNADEKQLIRRRSLGRLGRIYSHRLQELNLAYLIKEVEDLENTKTKEFMIRQWCTQNTAHDELSYGIELWLDTVIRDENFVISLRSLRQLSELLQKLNVVDRRRIINRFQITTIESLRTPWEEWVGFHLNIAEAICDYDKNNAINKINEVYNTINVEIEDFDIKVFCYARLWGAYQRVGLDNDEDVKNNLQRVLSHLLKHSALQDEILNKTLRILAGIDISYALEVADSLNTAERRKLAKKIVLINGYIKQSTTDLSVQLKQVMDDFDIFDQDNLVYDLIEELSERKIIIDTESQRLLFHKTRMIKDQINKSITLVNLASFWTNKSVIGIPKILSEAQASWQDEDDLKKKIVIGFQLVEQIAYIDKDYAKKFYEDVQSTLIFPGAELAAGELGVMYVNSIDLAIRSLSSYNLSEPDLLERIYDQIDKLPCTYLCLQLYAQLAARIYSIGIYPEADEIVQDKILQKLNEVSNQDIREKVIRFSLPLIFWYSPELAIKYSKELSSSTINRSWFLVVLWSLSKGQLGDVQNFEHFKVASIPATIRDKALVALKQIKEDAIIYKGVIIITKSIEYSVRNKKLDPKNAFDVLLEVENFITNNLPDKMNIEHNGYKIISLARINGARSYIYKNISRKGQFSKINIMDGWRELENMAKSDIENLADRTFVITKLAEEMNAWNPDKAKILLENVSYEIRKIPSILDRSDRIDGIAKTWGMWGENNQAAFFYSQSIELINELTPWDQDKKLEHIVQAAYEISPDFADELVERLDSRFSDRELKPYQLKLKSLMYTDNLGQFIEESKENQSQLQGLLIQLSVNRLLNDLVNQNAYLPQSESIREMIYRSSFYDPNVVNDVLKWVIECENRQPRPYKTGMFDVFMQASEFIQELAKWTSPLAQKRISPDIYGLLPGLSSKVVVFQAGHRKRAENWVKNWITKNAVNYIKICDPYFGPQELVFLSEVHRDIKILIITTTEKFEYKENPEKIRQELLQTWRKVGKGKIPSMTLLIVPAKLERTFHDRAIVTGKNGLNVGPSLNSLGNELQNITELEYNEAKELEVKYIDDMLNQGKWFLDHSVHPVYIIID